MPDWLGQSTVASNGTSTVNMKHNLNGIVWEVEEVSVRTGQVASATTASIFKNGNLVAPSAALTPLPTGQGTAAGGLPYEYLTASDELEIQVQGAVSGDTVTVRAQYREFQSNDPAVVGR